MATTPTIEQDVPGRDGRPGLLLRTPYHPDFVDVLKAEIPKGDRRWDPDAGAWWIAEDRRDLAEHLTLRFWPTVQVLGLEGEDDHLVSRNGERLYQPRLF